MSRCTGWVHGLDLCGHDAETRALSEVITASGGKNGYDPNGLPRCSRGRRPRGGIRGHAALPSRAARHQQGLKAPAVVSTLAFHLFFFGSDQHWLRRPHDDRRSGPDRTQFGLATTMFYIAYIACGIPSNMVLARIGARIWIGSLMIAWGLASTVTMFATSANTLVCTADLSRHYRSGFSAGHAALSHLLVSQYLPRSRQRLVHDRHADHISCGVDHLRATF